MSVKAGTCHESERCVSVVYGDTPRQASWRDYRAAVAEFDRLWETGGSRRQPEKMKRLLLAIESFEKAALPNH